MNISITPLEGIFVFEPKIFKDNRGFFYESFNQRIFEEATGITYPFVQHNQSRSSYGVLRGLHFQRGEFAQAKLVRVVKGKVWDVVIDIRPNSPTFKQHFGIELSEENRKQLYIPKGLAHGFSVLSETADFAYLCDNYYAPQAESGIVYNDPTFEVDWKIPEEDMIVSEKDKALPTFTKLSLT